jgi:beta-glucosidase
LPITFPRALTDVPANTPTQYPGVDGVAHYTEGVFVGYRHYDAKQIDPLFAFGFGLSYTSFEYRNLKISRTTVSAAHPEDLTVDVDVRNTGKLVGAEIAQLYLGLPSTDVPQPPQQLKGFEKIVLKPGQSGHVRFTIDARALSYWDVNSHSWHVASGHYTVAVGSSSRLIRGRASFEVQ